MPDPASSPARAPAPDADDVLTQVSRWSHEGAAALATVVSTWGSSPRPAGSQLAVSSSGAFAGSVSGGCVEGAVVESALGTIESGRPVLLEFGVTDEMAWEVGLACGGEIEVWVERIDPHGTAATWLEAVLAIRRAKQSAVATLDLHDGTRRLLAEGEAPAPLTEAAVEALRSDRCAIVLHGDRRIFLQPLNPPLRLIVVGAVHIAQPLVRMAAECGYEVIVVDPRGAFASPARFRDVTICTDWPDRALQDLAIDARSAVVTLTHDPKLDDPALAVALRSPAFYVGALGSRRTQARRVERLRELGLSDVEIERIHGPVGLPIGARSPAEIAVSILGQVTEQLRSEAACRP